MAIGGLCPQSTGSPSPVVVMKIGNREVVYR
jgi:hypothetical protein